MSKITLKENDVYRWSWNEEEYKKKQDQINAGTVYWCMSQIGIVKDGVLVDTYWGMRHDAKYFTPEEVDSKLDVKYLGNLDDYELSSEHNKMYYLDSDCLDLNHPNRSKGNFYIRKGAERNLEKMKRIKNRDIAQMQFNINYLQDRLNQAKEDLSNMKVEDNFYIVSKYVSFDDNSYMDTE